MNNDVFSYTQLTFVRLFITWQLVSTASVGHPQAIVLERERMRKLGTLGTLYIKNVFALYKSILNCSRSREILKTL